MMDMTEELKGYLRDKIATGSMVELCDSVNAIGPYVSGLSLTNPLSVNQLAFYTHADVRRVSYRQFQIPKKSGGVRAITAPEGELKEVLRTLAYIFSELYIPTKEATAFITGRSILDNALPHTGRNYVLNLDLSDFFTSITAEMVQRGLVKVGIPSLVAQDLATICTYPNLNDHRVCNVLPQGSPASPVLSNICAMTLDHRLAGLAKRFHLTYTRYADDITFSSQHNVYQAEGEFMKELFRIVEECRFSVNPNKTRLLKQGTRQEVTGLTVSEKPNVSRKYIKNLRAMIHYLHHQEHPVMHDVNVVRGKLNFLRMVKGKDDSTYVALVKKLNRSVKGKKFVKNNL